MTLSRASRPAWNMNTNVGLYEQRNCKCVPNYSAELVFLTHLITQDLLERLRKIKTNRKSFF